MKLYLIGMPLSGKSTIGKLVSKALNLKFIDLDEMIVNIYHESITEMFKKGEDYFRQRETETLKSLYKEDNVVISCGGGIVVKKENKEYFDGLVIYLRVNISSLEKRQVENRNLRPLLKENSLLELYEKRKDKYESFSNKIIENEDKDKTVEEIIGYYYENISN